MVGFLLVGAAPAFASGDDYPYSAARTCSTTAQAPPLRTSPIYQDRKKVAAGMRSVVGASLGATLVLHAALADPRGMRSLALFEPPLLLPGQHLHGVRARYEALTAAGDHAKAGLLLAREVIHLPEELVALLANAPAPDPVDAHREARGWIGDLRQLAADTTDTARWSAITLPTLLMQGADTWPPIPE